MKNIYYASLIFVIMWLILQRSMKIRFTVDSASESRIISYVINAEAIFVCTFIMPSYEYLYSRKSLIVSLMHWWMRHCHYFGTCSPTSSAFGCFTGVSGVDGVGGNWFISFQFMSWKFITMWSFFGMYCLWKNHNFYKISFSLNRI